MTSVAIITARGGSKRIPGKNIRDFCGKPIIAYSIEAAKECGLFNEIMVSTDNEEIANVARRYGADVPFMRSLETSDDYATTADVLREVLSEYEKRGQRFTWMCCLYPTAPFVTSARLRNAYALFRDTRTESVIPVVRFSHPPQRAFVLRNGYISYAHPEYARSRSQDLEPLYHDAGQFYIYDTDAFLQSMQPDSKDGGHPLRVHPLILSEAEVQDIDDISDWKLAEIKYRVLTGKL